MRSYLLGGLLCLLLLLFLRHVAFSPNSSPYHAAGIIPVSQDPRSKIVFLLLGVDHHTSKWADFGGLRDYLEEDPFQTACREFIEETIGLTSTSTADKCYEELENPALTTGHINSYSEAKQSSFLAHFLKISYDPELPAKFIEKRKTAKLASDLEKLEIAWIPLDVVVDNLPKCCAKASPRPVEGCSLGGDRYIRKTVAQTFCQALHSGAFDSLKAEFS